MVHVAVEYVGSGKVLLPGLDAATLGELRAAVDEALAKEHADGDGGHQHTHTLFVGHDLTCSLDGDDDLPLNTLLPAEATVTVLRIPVPGLLWPPYGTSYRVTCTGGPYAVSLEKPTSLSEPTVIVIRSLVSSAKERHIPWAGAASPSDLLILHTHSNGYVLVATGGVNLPYRAMTIWALDDLHVVYSGYTTDGHPGHSGHPGHLGHRVWSEDLDGNAFHWGCGGNENMAGRALVFEAFTALATDFATDVQRRMHWPPVAVWADKVRREQHTLVTNRTQDHSSRRIMCQILQVRTRDGTVTASAKLPRFRMPWRHQITNAANPFVSHGRIVVDAGTHVHVLDRDTLHTITRFRKGQHNCLVNAACSPNQRLVAGVLLTPAEGLVCVVWDVATKQAWVQDSATGFADTFDRGWAATRANALSFPNNQLLCVAHLCNTGAWAVERKEPWTGDRVLKSMPKLTMRLRPSILVARPAAVPADKPCVKRARR
jgi:hypothetical protein